MVNAPTVAAAACQRQPWPQRTKPSKTLGLECNFSPKSRPGTVRLKYRQLCQQRAPQCSAVTRSNASGSGHWSDGIQLLRCSGSSMTPMWSPANLAELLVKVSCRLVGTLAALSLVTQPAPAHAGKIIQGMPRISDGDTLQVNFLCRLTVALLASTLLSKRNVLVPLCKTLC